MSCGRKPQEVRRNVLKVPRLLHLMRCRMSLCCDKRKIICSFLQTVRLKNFQAVNATMPRQTGCYLILALIESKHGTKGVHNFSHIVTRKFHKIQFCDNKWLQIFESWHRKIAFSHAAFNKLISEEMSSTFFFTFWTKSFLK